MHNDFTDRHSEMPPMTDEIKSRMGAIRFNILNLLQDIQGNYRALFELQQILLGLLDNCDLNLQRIRIPDGDSEEPVQLAIGLTDLPILEKKILVSTAITSTVAIQVVSAILGCTFEQAASHVEQISQNQFGGMSLEQIESAVAVMAKTLRENPDGGAFVIPV